MVQYFILVNLDKREYIHPHDLKCGAKLFEIHSETIIKNLMLFLLTTKNGEIASLNQGRWANNKVIFVGDTEDYPLFKQVITDFKNISKNAYNEYLNYNKR